MYTTLFLRLYIRSSLIVNVANVLNIPLKNYINISYDSFEFVGYIVIIDFNIKNS